MASKALVLLCILAVVFVIAYAEESASDETTNVHSNEAEKNADNKVNGIVDAKYSGYHGGGYPGSGGGYPGRGGYPGGGYPGRGGYPGGRGNNCRFGCCGRKDYNGNCQRCCPHAV